jgi:hypothetical protein
MPSSTRKQRPNSRKQPHNHEHHQRSLEDPSAPHALRDSPRSPPHPYHENLPPPPPVAQEQLRSISAESKLSDISMDDFDKNNALESVLEYSDTSDDMREDNYFMPQENPYAPPGSILGLGNQYYHHRSQHGGPNHHHHHRRSGAHHDPSRGRAGESAFRELRRGGLGSKSKSSRIVRFGSGSAGGADEDGSSSPRNDDSHGGDRLRNDDPKVGNWMKKVAHAFRSPSPGLSHKKVDVTVGAVETKTEHSRSRQARHAGEANATHHQRVPSDKTMEYPHSMLHLRDPNLPSTLTERTSIASSASYETSPLLMRTHQKAPVFGSGFGLYGGLTNEGMLHSASAALHSSYHPLKLTTGGTSAREGTRSSLGRRNDEEGGGGGMEKGTDDADAIEFSRPDHYVFRSRTTAAEVSAYFLMDYEASRPPTLQSNFETIAARQLSLYRIHFSWQWRWFVNLAILGLFLSHTQNRLSTAILHSCVIAVFVIEIQMKESMYGTAPREDARHTERRLVRPMAAFLFLLGLESWMWYLFTVDEEQTKSSPPLISSIFKPLVFFYVSAKARDSLEALWRISRIVSRVLIIEFGLILTFAAVGCRLFGAKHETFHNLSASWLSLFERKCGVIIKSYLTVVFFLVQKTKFPSHTC